jgi:hypothetical protein
MRMTRAAVKLIRRMETAATRFLESNHAAPFVQ